jgi:formylglycine-generating enzyme required for sulfatase activity
MSLAILAGPNLALSRAATIGLYGEYAGLNITGPTGAVCSIQYVTNLAQTNAWLVLTNLTLSNGPCLWVDTTGPALGRRFYMVRTGPAHMVWIEPGTFTLGSPTNEVDRYSDEGPQTVVTLTLGFFIGEYEVTQGEYVAVTGSNPSYFTGDSNRPVERVSWFNATNYCGELTAQELAAGRLAAGWAYRLPTEAEWEYACRAGTTTRFSYGDDPDYTELANYAWYRTNSGDQTRPVGQKLPNSWGLYDMYGNVYEWCEDWYDDAYPGGSVTDPHGPATGSLRLVRGASCHGIYPRDFRSACRNICNPSQALINLGFRIVLAPSPP